MSLTLILLAGASLGAALVWARLRSVQEEPCHIWRCPSCGQKLRYRAHKAGRAGGCPRCLREWILPATPQELPASRGSDHESEAKRPGAAWRAARISAVPQTR
jgi:hypothetical protein